MRLRTALGMVGVAALVGGCGGLGDNFQQPAVQLDRVILRGIGLTGGTLDLVVNVDNPNNFDLKGTRLQVGFDVQDSHVGDIDWQDQFLVNKDGIATLTLPVTFNWAGVGGAVRTALGYGDLPYKMQGQVHLATPWGRKVVPFTHEGRAPLTRSGGGVPIPGAHS
jgi:LEA14-like dessication related protein